MLDFEKIRKIPLGLESYCEVCALRKTSVLPDPFLNICNLLVVMGPYQQIGSDLVTNTPMINPGPELTDDILCEE